MFLGVNIDHIAVLREARKINDPNFLEAALVASKHCDQITLHVREDRRHAHEKDLEDILTHCPCVVNLECAASKEMIELACKLKPSRITLVPEKRQELTTEGGLKIEPQKLQKVVETLHANDIEVSLFIDANAEDIKKAQLLKADFIELHTGHFANIYSALHTNILKTPYKISALDLPRTKLQKLLDDELERLQEATKLAQSLGLKVAAGHGLNYKNVHLITQIQGICELNIGQSIIARAVFVGLKEAILEMKACMK
ncbi:pyridoxine 5'-phosphate synthase [Campylobacter sp. MIT 99-7217]|uniref:pyridoxine 5'-phosphate synthase n=1 Tax=Campylobacter sp. MIT 99-7217 TaxID=535091 RepID=UPI00115739D0|nr:pyridoxine 5'-phosphate synthase [Campylobacter sp. MIT 99-7217]TQR31919.1 pyridoxine 5'-phosphate synthase [Campylobacter sp. MIT 99-7217]